jgi:hypothetical protein
MQILYTGSPSSSPTTGELPSPVAAILWWSGTRKTGSSRLPPVRGGGRRGGGGAGGKAAEVEVGACIDTRSVIGDSFYVGVEAARWRSISWFGYLIWIFTIVDSLSMVSVEKGPTRLHKLFSILSLWRVSFSGLSPPRWASMESSLTI